MLTEDIVAFHEYCACTSASLEPSYVLRALGTLSAYGVWVDTHVSWHTGAAEDMAHSSLRFGIGRFTTEAEIDFVVKNIVRVVHRLREMRWVPVFHAAIFS